MGREESELSEKRVRSVDYLAIAKKVKAEFRKARGATAEAPEPVEEGRIIAVLVASSVLETDIWLAFDEGFKQGDDVPVFFASELPFLRKMSQQELRRRYQEKRNLGGGWIRDRSESTKH